MILRPVESTTGKRKSRKGKGARRRQQQSQRKRSKNAMLARAAWLAQKKGIPAITVKQQNDTTLDIVPKAAVTSASVSRLVGYGLLSGAVYAILRK